MTDGPREELRALLLDSAPPAGVDGDAMFARTFAAGEGAGAELLPPDGLFDLPADDAAPDDDLVLDDPDAGDITADDTPDDTVDDTADDTGDDLPSDEHGADDGGWDDHDVPADPAHPDGAGDLPFDPSAGW